MVSHISFFLPVRHTKKARTCLCFVADFVFVLVSRNFQNKMKTARTGASSDGF